MNWTLLALVCGLVGVLASGAKDDEEREMMHRGKFIAKITTRTRLALSTATTTVPFTCASLSTSVCRRRRLYKRSWLGDAGREIESEDVELFSGQVEEPQVAGDRRSGRISFTIGTVTTTTFTITSTSVNSATTFSVSYYCSAPNAVYPPAC